MTGPHAEEGGSVGGQSVPSDCRSERQPWLDGVKCCLAAAEVGETEGVDVWLSECIQKSIRGLVVGLCGGSGAYSAVRRAGVVVAAGGGSFRCGRFAVVGKFRPAPAFFWALV